MSEQKWNHPLELKIIEMAQTQIWRTPELEGKKEIQVFFNGGLKAEGEYWRLIGDGEYLIFTGITMTPKDVVAVRYRPMPMDLPTEIPPGEKKAHASTHQPGDTDENEPSKLLVVFLTVVALLVFAGGWYVAREINWSFGYEQGVKNITDPLERRIEVLEKDIKELKR